MERFDIAATLFIKDYTSTRDYLFKLCKKHGLAWKEENQQITNDNNSSSNPLTAAEAAALVSLNVQDFLDVKLAYTSTEELNNDDNVTKVSFKKFDVNLGNHGSSFLLGIHGHFISPTFCNMFLAHLHQDLAFCTSPSSNRMLRVSSTVEGGLFLLGGKVSVATLFDPIARISWFPFFATYSR